MLNGFEGAGRRVAARRVVLNRAAKRAIRRAAVLEPLEKRELLSAASLDASFSGDGKVTADLGGGDVAAAVLSLAGNKVLVAGSDGKNAALLRYTSAGILDTTFSGDGKVATRFSSNTTNVDGINALAALAGGKFLGAGFGNNTFALARYNADGSLDTTFGPGHTGIVTSAIVGFGGATATAIAVQGDGKILLAGSTVKTHGQLSDLDVALLRYNADGSADTTFGPAHNGQATFDFKGSDDTAAGVAGVANGKIVVAATLSTSGGAFDTDIGVIRFNADGTLDKSFSPGGTDGDGVATADFTPSGVTTHVNDAAAAILISCGSRIIVAGTTHRGTAASPNDDFALVKFRYGGALDTTFGAAHTGKVTTDFGTPGDDAFALKMTPANKLLVAGYSITGPTGKQSYDFAAASYNANGTPDATFDPGATTTVGKQTVTANFLTSNGVGSPDAAYALSVGSDGKFVLAGTANGDFAVARYNGTAPSGDGNDHLCGSVHVAPTHAGVFSTGAIDSPTDIDLYAIDVAAGQTIGFDVDPTAGSTLDSYLRLFDFEGNAIAFNDNGAAIGETLGNSSYLKYTFATAGTYYIGISGAGNIHYDPTTEDGAVAGSTGGYSLVFTDLTTIGADAAGNTTSTSKAVSIGSTISESISLSTDVDLYSISVVAGQTIGFDIDQSSGSTLDSYLRIFNFSGVQIASNNDGAAVGETTSTASYLSYTFVSGGTYYIGVSGYSDISYNIFTGGGATSGSTGGYSLIISNLTTDAAGSSTSTSKVVSIGSTTSESISTSTDIDVYKITVVGGQTISFNLNVGGSFDSYLRLFNSAGTQISFNDNGAAPGETLGSASYLSYTFASGGTYYIGVSGHGNSAYNVTTGGGATAGSTGAYTLIVNNQTPTGDPDDQISEAHYVAAGTLVTDSISNATDVDMFYVNVPAGATFEFDVDQVSSSLDSYLRLFKSDGTQLASNDNGAARGEALGTSAYLSYTFATAGWYYIAVSGAPNKSYDAISGNGDVSGSTGGYSLTVIVPSGTDPDDQISEAHPMALNSTVSDSISNSLDVDAYKFTATAGSLIGIDIDVPAGSALDAYIEVVLPSGQYTTYNSGGAAPDEAYDPNQAYLEYLVPTTGTYYIFVAGNPNENFNPITGNGDVPGAIGAYSLTLTDIKAQDPDDTLDAAHPIAVGASASDTISNPNDVDVYEFTVAAGRTIGFDIDLPAGSALDSYIEIANTSGQYISYNSGGSAPDEAYNSKESYFEYTFATGGTFYVAVSCSANENFNLNTGGNDHAGTLGTSGSYKLTLTDIGAQDPNDQLTEASTVSTSTTINDSISNPNDVDLFKFTVSDGQKLSFDIDIPGGSALYSYIEVINSAGQYITYNAAGTAPGETYDPHQSYLEYTFTTGGTYYVAVACSANENFNLLTGGSDHAGVSGTSGAYSLTIRNL